MSLNAVATVAASALPRTGSRICRLPAATADAAAAMSRSGRVIRRLKTGPPHQPHRQDHHAAGGEPPRAGRGALARLPVGQQHQPAGLAAVAPGERRKLPPASSGRSDPRESSGRTPRAPAPRWRRARRLGGRRSRRGWSRPRGGRPAAATSDCDHPRQLARRAVVEQVSERQRPEHLIGEERRRAHHQEERTGEGTSALVARPFCAWPIASSSAPASGRRGTAAGPGLASQSPLVVGHDGELTRLDRAGSRRPWPR